MDKSDQTWKLKLRKSYSRTGCRGRGEKKKKIQKKKTGQFKKFNHGCDIFQILSKVVGGERGVVIIIYTISIK